VIPIADRHLAAGRELAAGLGARGLRVEVDDSDGRMQNKIRLAQEQKVPCMLVLGDREVEARTATVRLRDAASGAVQETLAWDELADRLAAESAARRISGEPT
jgi:threonyl-tRNA synthetase